MISNVTGRWVHSVAMSGRQLGALSDDCIPLDDEILSNWGWMVVSILPVVALVVCTPFLCSETLLKGLLNHFKHMQGPKSGQYDKILGAVPGTFPFGRFQTKYLAGILELAVGWLEARVVSAWVEYAFLSPALASTETKHSGLVSGWRFQVERWLFGENASLFHLKEWERVHNIVFQLFNNDQADVLYPSVKSACLDVVDSVEEGGQQSDGGLCCMDLGGMILSMAVSSSIQICFGYESDENVRAVKIELEKIFSENGEMWYRTMLQVVPWCSWIPFSRSREVAKAMSGLREATLDVVEDYTYRLKQRPHSRNPQEKECHIAGWDGLSQKVHMPPRRSLFGIFCDPRWYEKGCALRKEEICNNLLTFMMAELSRTARALSCIVNEVAKSRHMQDALHADIDRAMAEKHWCGPGDGLQWLTWGTVDRCPYLSCLVEACFRLCPSITGFDPRKLNEVIHFDSTATHRFSVNLACGKSAHTCRLEEYVDNLMARMAEPNAHSSFSSPDGRTRPCAGRCLYLMEIKTGLFTIFRKFDVEACDSSHHHKCASGACRVRWKPRW